MAKKREVFGCDKKETVDFAMSLPMEIKTDDGRELKVIEWRPVAAAGRAIEVTVLARVCVDEE